MWLEWLEDIWNHKIGCCIVGKMKLCGNSKLPKHWIELRGGKMACPV